MATSCVPASTVLSGYTQNFADPMSKHNTAGIVISVVGMVITTLFMLLRLYTKAFLAHIFGIDDVALTIAWMMSIALQIMVVYLWAEKTIGVHMWDLCIQQANSSILLISVCSILYIPLMALAKFSLLLFYRKLSMDRWFKYSVYGVMAFVISYSIALAFSLIFACTPLERNWDITITAGSCVNKGRIYLATAGLNAATDVILLILPTPMIWQLSVPLVQKIGLACIFGIGSLTLITSLVRLSLLPPMVSALDTTWAISTPAIWICVEANLVIICGCLPILRLFFRHVAPRLIGEYPETTASKPSSRGKRPIHSVAELSILDGAQRRSAASKQYGRLNEWNEIWERDLGGDADSEICTVDSTGRVVAVNKSSKSPSGSASKHKKRPNAPIWCGGQVESAPRSPGPSYVVGRNDDGRYSLRPSAA
ncbi:integral membrane [Lecanosticta acicola]|uniref:Integral membrane n=1 Tax=Lecanosticta acicola TaxID=111012 RepID=A0AAI9E868_9PEZI|nr:integral membrane [Lecanosticta acicola]